MGEATWQQWRQRLTAAPRPLPRRGELWQWLEHQKGLHALGWLPPPRRRVLEAAQVRLPALARAALAVGGRREGRAEVWQHGRRN